MSILIKKGTKVLSEQNAVVELLGDVIVDKYAKDKDGGYVYQSGKRGYYVSSGSVTLI